MPIKTKFFKVTSLPADPEPSAFYYVENGDFVESYLTDNSGVLKLLGNSEMINSLITASPGGGGGTGGSFLRINVTIQSDNQSVFVLADTPDNIDLRIDRVPQKEDVDYTYVSSTGTLTLLNTDVIAGIHADSCIEAIGYSIGSSSKEILTVTSVGQSEFFLTDTPQLVNLVLERVPLKDGVDYSYTSSTKRILLLNTAYIEEINLNSFIEARKLF